VHINTIGQLAFGAVLSIVVAGCSPLRDQRAIFDSKQALGRRKKNVEELVEVRGRLRKIIETKLKAAQLLESTDRVLGRKFMEMGNYALAEEVLREAETLKPTNPYIKMDLGECWYFLGISTVEQEKRPGHFARSKRYFLMALDLKPDLYEARYGYGLLLFFAYGDTPGAIKEMSKLIEERPGFGDAHFALGRFYYESGELEKALGEYLTLTRILSKNSAEKKKAEENIERINRERASQ